MDDSDTVVPESALGEGRVDFASVADEVKGGDSRVGLQGSLHSLNYDPTAVVATHDIHCNAHRDAPGLGRALAHAAAALRPPR